MTGGDDILKFRQLTLSNKEIRIVAGNVAPYFRGIMFSCFAVSPSRRIIPRILQLCEKR